MARIITKCNTLSLQPPVYDALVKIVRFNDKNTKKYGGWNLMKITNLAFYFNIQSK